MSKPVEGSKSRKQWCKEVLIDNLLIIFLILAVIIGVGLGFGLREVWSPDDKRKLFYMSFPGQLLMNMLKMLILPLIISSLITGLASLDKKASGKLGLGAIIYYMSTTLTAVIIGIVLVLSIQPGHKGDSKITRKGKAKNTKPLDALLDLIRNCFPPNLVGACFQKQETVVKMVQKAANPNVTTLAPIMIETPEITNPSGMNVLGLVVFSIALGIVINHLGPVGKPLQYFFESLNAATMVLIKLVIWYSPIGIMFLIAVKFAEMDDPVQIVKQLGFYSITVLAGLFIHGFVVLPLIYFVATRKNPFKFIFNMLKALLTAWGTASSSATLPITMECLVFRNGIHRNVVRFVAPVGATINMDGTALYEAVAAIFIAQYNGTDLGVADVIIVSLTATAAAIGAAGVPQAGLVTMVIVLTAVNLPTDDVTLILAIDWFLDRFRTAINVLGDSFGAGILAHIFRRTFENIPDVEEEIFHEMNDEPRSLDPPETKGKDYQLSRIYPSINGSTDGQINSGFMEPTTDTRM